MSTFIKIYQCIPKSNYLVLAALVIFCAVGIKSYTAYAQTPSLGEATVLPAAETETPVELFLKIDDIEGEYTDDMHNGEIGLVSYTWEVANTGGKARVNMTDFNFIKKIDKSSPILMLSAANGKHYKEAILTVRKKAEEPQEFLIVKMQDVVITSYRPGGSTDKIPTDQFSLNFSQIEYKYIPQGPDGVLGIPVTASWDLKTNRSI